MKTLELTEEQIDMIANCIISQIKMCQYLTDTDYQNEKITEAARSESVKLKTLLNYINS